MSNAGDVALLEARKLYVAFVKEEERDSEPWARSSLKAHWAGAKSGFSNHRIQREWEVFLAGYKAAKRSRL